MRIGENKYSTVSIEERGVLDVLAACMSVFSISRIQIQEEKALQITLICVD